MISSRGGGQSFLIEPGEQHRGFRLTVRLTHAGAENFDALLEFVG